MKINILDAGINRRSGHHYDYCLRLARYYSANGMNVHVFGGAQMDEETQAEFAKFGEINRLLRARPYQSPRRFDFYGGEIFQHHKQAQITAEDLEGVDDADVWLWPSIGAHEIDACARRNVRGKIVGCVHADPGVEARSVAAQLWRTSLLIARDAKLHFTLCAYENELRHRFALIQPSPRFAVIPHPVDGPAPEKPKERMNRIGFIGHQRSTKESPLRNMLLRRLVQDGFAITYQNSAPEVKSPDFEGVDVFGYVDDLAVPIAECDLVVLPYNLEFYAARGSGILAQCMALGVPTIAPVGTLPGRTIERHGIGPLSLGNGDAAIYQAIRIAARHYPTFSANAQRTARQFCKHNGIAKFAAAYLAAAK
jgi:glycosyltransferase involved in cell wall biosynthesis